ncbi:MAG: DUF3025 domain-containing protein [Myxococcales bacterium]|jgi:hypothetical protein|nr:DUF3025 domain-containing protein [Myxococcales bacterium]HQY63853.1 DUF3025 domain-containing protein [Polyangiaceae bacterium]
MSGRLARGPAGAPPAWTRGWLVDPSRWVFDGVRHVAAPLAERDAFPTVAELDALLRGSPQLEAQAPLPARRPRGARPAPDGAALYDVRITRDARLPTREGSWHDLMNALVFRAFPRAKAALHARQAGELLGHLDRHGALPGARTRLQDVLAMLDEGGALLAVRPQDAAGLHRAIAAGETQLGGARVLVFGHAILEHAVLGAPLPRAAPVVLCDPEPDGPLSPLVARLDDALAAYMGAVTGAPMPPALALDALDADARP